MALNGMLRSHIKKTFSNSMLQWRWSEPVEPGGPECSAEPGKPDPNVWVGPHAFAGYEKSRTVESSNFYK